MDLLKILLISTLASILTGQLVRFPLFKNTGAITLTDLLVIFLDAVFLMYALLIKKSLILPPKIFIPFLFFAQIVILSIIFALNFFPFDQIIVSSLFAVRFLTYFFICIVVLNLVKKSEILKFVNLFLAIGALFTLSGFVQFLIFPDFTPIVRFGWDPHRYRLASTFLDPNYAGYLLSVLIAFATSLYLYQRKTIYLILCFLASFALILTLSRSSYLAVIAVILIIGFIKSPKILVLASLIFLLSFITVPQVKARIIGAVTFDETAQSRIKSWQNAITIFKNNPVLGTGFNTYRFAQAKSGFFSLDDPLGGHSGSGSDSSFLLILATTGLIGASCFLFLLMSIFLEFSKQLKSNYLHLAAFSAFAGILVHSQLVNSFFFPQIMLILWFVTGLVMVANTKKQ